MSRIFGLACLIAGLIVSSQASAKTVNILAFGQSNMQGRFGPASEFTGPDPNIRAWNWESSQFETAELGVSPFWPDYGGNGPANNLAFVFAQDLVKKCNVQANIVLLATYDAKIEYFLPSDILGANAWSNTQKSSQFGSSLADELFGDEGASRLALTAAKAGAYDIVLVHQGEANSLADGDKTAAYAKKVRALIDELARRKFVRFNTEFIFGTINRKYPNSAEQKEALLELQAPTVGVADWDGIETYDEPGKFGDKDATGNGLKTLGDRYFAKYMSLMGGNCPGT